jgi:hypothetical protein
MDREGEIRRLEKLADWLDSRFIIPGTNVRFGLDSVLGLIPGLGDTVTALPAIYVVMAAQKLGVSRFVLMRMIGNVGVDMLLGAIPLLGDLFDVGFKANRRNVALLRRHLTDRDPEGVTVIPPSEYRSDPRWQR